jgi:hypothetical protein
VRLGSSALLTVSEAGDTPRGQRVPTTLSAPVFTVEGAGPREDWRGHP